MIKDPNRNHESKSKEEENEYSKVPVGRPENLWLSIIINDHHISYSWFPSFTIIEVRRY